MKQHIIIVTLLSLSFLSVFAQSQPPEEIQVEKYLIEGLNIFQLEFLLGVEIVQKPRGSLA